MAQLINPYNQNPGGFPWAIRQSTHAPLPPGFMLNSPKKKKRKRISLKQNGPTRYEMMLGAVGLGSSSRPKKIRSKKKKSTAIQLRTLPEGLSTRMLTSGMLANPIRQIHVDAGGLGSRARPSTVSTSGSICFSCGGKKCCGICMWDKYGSRCVIHDPEISVPGGFTRHKEGCPPAPPGGYYRTDVSGCTLTTPPSPPGGGTGPQVRSPSGSLGSGARPSMPQSIRGTQDVRTPCPPGWHKVGETPWGGKMCWPKPGTPIVGRR